MLRYCAYLIICVSTVLQSTAASQYPGKPQYALKQVSESLYRFTADRHHSLVWKSGEGLVLLDTLGEDAAEWLKKKLSKTFQENVRYVVYSHNHHDHIYGAKVFDTEGISVISHEMVRENLQMTKASVPLPDITFSDKASLSLGGETLELRYHGPNNGIGSISMLFRKQRVLFIVDWIVVGRMPWRDLQGYDIDGMIRSTREVLALDWEVFIGGHADIGGRKEVMEYLRYLESLYAAVRDGLLDGKSVDELKETIELRQFNHFKNYDEWLPSNIEAVYRQLSDWSYLDWRPAN